MPGNIMLNNMSIIDLLFRKKEEPSCHEYIDYLLDKSNDLGGRDDAAMHLIRFDAAEVIEALIKVATDHTEEDMIIDSAGQSLQEIWSRNNVTPSADIVSRMHPSAKIFFK